MITAHDFIPFTIDTADNPQAKNMDEYIHHPKLSSDQNRSQNVAIHVHVCLVESTVVSCILYFKLHNDDTHGILHVCTRVEIQLHMLVANMMVWWVLPLSTFLMRDQIARDLSVSCHLYLSHQLPAGACDLQYIQDNRLHAYLFPLAMAHPHLPPF